jgi:hypothetical protein
VAETLGASPPVGGDFDGLHRPELRELRLEVGVRGVKS